MYYVVRQLSFLVDTVDILLLQYEVGKYQQDKVHMEKQRRSGRWKKMFQVDIELKWRPWEDKGEIEG